MVGDPNEEQNQQLGASWGDETNSILIDDRLGVNAKKSAEQLIEFCSMRPFRLPIRQQWFPLPLLSHRYIDIENASGLTAL